MIYAIDAGIGEQARVFLLSFPLGLALALLFDAARLAALAAGGGAHRAVRGTLDDAFWLLCAAAVSAFFFITCDGKVRFFVFFGAAGGAALYFSLLSRYVMAAGRRILRGAKRLCRLAQEGLMAPFVLYAGLILRLQRVALARFRSVRAGMTRKMRKKHKKSA